MRRAFVLLLMFSFQATFLFGAGHGIIIDGLFKDWEAISPIAQVPTGEASDDPLTLRSLRVTDDSAYLFLLMELSREILLQDNNRLTLYIDTDGKATTGQPVGSLGAEVAYTFGERKGRLYSGTDTLSLEYQHLGLVGAPSFSSKYFELALSWDGLGPNGVPCLPRGSLRLILRDEESGQALPAAGSLVYHPQLRPSVPSPPIDFERQDPSQLRLVSHNVNRRHFQPDKKDAFSRIYRALDPDILLLQEAYEGSAEEILEYFLPALGRSPTGSWYAYKAGEEATVLLSPYPAKQVISLGNSAAYLLELPLPHTSDLVLIALSMPCCRQDSARQAEADRIMAFARDLRKPDGSIRIDKGTPIVLAGDANLVGFREQYLTLLEGAIQDDRQYGPAFSPDWDGSPLTDLHPSLLQRPMTFTWRGNSFFPGRLDYVFYTDSVLNTGRSFIFDTLGLPAETLKRYALNEDDAVRTYHHLPLVVDFILKTTGPSN